MNLADASATPPPSDGPVATRIAVPAFTAILRRRPFDEHLHHSLPEKLLKRTHSTKLN